MVVIHRDCSTPYRGTSQPNYKQDRQSPPAVQTRPEEGASSMQHHPNGPQRSSGRQQIDVQVTPVGVVIPTQDFGEGRARRFIEGGVHCSG